MQMHIYVNLTKNIFCYLFTKPIQKKMLIIPIEIGYIRFQVYIFCFFFLHGNALNCIFLNGCIKIHIFYIFFNIFNYLHINPGLNYYLIL